MSNEMDVVLVGGPCDGERSFVDVDAFATLVRESSPPLDFGSLTATQVNEANPAGRHLYHRRALVEHDTHAYVYVHSSIAEGQMFTTLLSGYRASPPLDATKAMLTAVSRVVDAYAAKLIWRRMIAVWKNGDRA